jgi:hypothetical protein
MSVGGKAGGRSFATERNCLIEWFKNRGAVLNPDILNKFGPVSMGSEHAVYFDREGLRAIKCTRPNGFGHSVYAIGSHATPLEYLRRLGFNNHLFGDDIHLLGCFLSDDGAVQIVSSQPWVTASLTEPDASDEQIATLLAEVRFKRSRLFSEAAVFYSPELNLVVGDAHGGNVLVSEAGDVVPIDLVIGQPCKELEAKFRLENPQAESAEDDSDITTTTGGLISSTQIEIDFGYFP